MAFRGQVPLFLIISLVAFLPRVAEAGTCKLWLGKAYFAKTDKSGDYWDTESGNFAPDPRVQFGPVKSPKKNDLYEATWDEEYTWECEESSQIIIKVYDVDAVADDEVFFYTATVRDIYYTQNSDELRYPNDELIYFRFRLTYDY